MLDCFASLEPLNSKLHKFQFYHFQPGREDAYREILYDRELLLEDRVGFACRFLSDARLLKFVGSQCSEEVAVGNIRAIVLTGKFLKCIR